MSERPSHTESELVEFLRSIDVRAPDALHQRVEALVAERSPRGRSRRPLGTRASAGLRPLGWRLGGAIAIVAAAAVALVLGLTGGGSAALNVRQASASTLRPATMAAPPENPLRRAQLAVAVDGVAFPYWEDRFGWRSTGARTDRIGGRPVTTVFYANGRGQRIGYAIVAGTPAPRVGGGVVVWRGGTPYRLSTDGALRVVTWLRDGHLCVVAGRGVSSATLLALASGDDRRTVA
jgi:hypothetical protein